MEGVGEGAPNLDNAFCFHMCQFRGRGGEFYNFSYFLGGFPSRTLPGPSKGEKPTRKPGIQC